LEFSYFKKLVDEYRNDKESVYNTWFLQDKDRLKAFRTIKSGVNDVIKEIQQNTFGNDFKGSSLETVVTAISEQKQVFEGAAHAFYWKPKLRIPDIYENEENKKIFGRFLQACLLAKDEKKIVDEILKLNGKRIKGLGPAVANILYFLHPTLFPPFNTCIVNGFNALFQKKMKLGSWLDYLEMRETIIETNQIYRQMLSNDYGAISGLLFEIGIGRIVIPENAEKIIAKEEEKKLKTIKKRHLQVLADFKEENEHSEMQYSLGKLGRQLGYDVWIAQNDHSKQWNGLGLGELSIKKLPNATFSEDVYKTVSLIDVIWLDSESHIIGAFEVEKSTSIYSGILRLHDLATSMVDGQCQLYLLAPNKREKDIQAQLLRPSLQLSLQKMPISYITFNEFKCNCEAMCKFGENIDVLEKIAKKPWCISDS
jgi:type II restriction enzyme